VNENKRHPGMCGILILIGSRFYNLCILGLVLGGIDKKCVFGKNGLNGNKDVS
jgi:hypothetical protein